MIELSAAVSTTGPQNTARPVSQPFITEDNYFDRIQQLLGILSLGAGPEFEGTQVVNVNRLIYPIEKQVANAAQVAKMGPFNWAKYQPIEVTIRNGDMYLMNGVHRVESALQAGITNLPAYITRY